MKKNIYLFIIPIIAMVYITPLDVPELKHRVNDFANILSNDEVVELENILANAENKNSSQIVLLTIPTLEGESLEDYSFKVAEKNKIGQKELDNGVLLIVANAEKKIRIEVGYGLEHIITDMKAGFIIREIIVKYFKNGDYYNGMKNGLLAIAGLVNDEFEITPEQLEKYKRGNSSNLGDGLIFFLMIIVIFSINILAFFRRSRRSTSVIKPNPALLLNHLTRPPKR